MNRVQFMEQLKKLLSDISEEERKEALAYYESYFDEAGADQEAEVINELGSPGKVAAIIKADLRGNNDSRGEYTENGYRDEETQEPLQTPQRREGYHARERGRGGKAAVILVLILLVFLSPFIGGGVGAALGILVCILLLPLVLVLIAGIAAVALFVGGVAAISAAATACMAGSVAGGLLGIGAGLVMIALAILAAVLTVWLATRVLPGMLRKFTDFCSNLLYGRRKKEA